MIATLRSRGAVKAPLAPTLNVLVMSMVLLLLLSLLIVFSLMAVRRVPPGQVHSLYRLGRAHRLLQPGVHLSWPLLERVAHRIDLGGRTLRIENAQGLRGTVYWQVLEPERADPVIEQADQLIRRGALDALQREPAPQPLDWREQGSRTKLALNALLRERGLMVTRVELEAG